MTKRRRPDDGFIRDPAGGAPAEDDPRRCTTIKRNGERCARWAILGGNVCGAHGGSMGHVRRAARRRLQKADLERKVIDLIEELDLSEHQDHTPSEVLSSAVGRSADMAAALQLVVHQLSIMPLVTEDEPGETGEVEVADIHPAGRMVAAWFGPDHLGDGAPHVLMEMYRVWNEQAAKIAKMAMDAGLDQRRVEIAEAQGQQLAAVLQGTLAALLALVVRLVESGTATAGDVRAVWASEVPAIVRGQIAAVTGKPLPLIPSESGEAL